MKQTGAVASKISNEFHARTSSRASANIDRSRVCMRFGKSLAPTAAFHSFSPRVLRSSLRARAVRETKCKNAVCVWHWAREKKHTSEQINSDRSWREVFAASVLTSAHPHFSALRAFWVLRLIYICAWEMRASREMQSDTWCNCAWKLTRFTSKGVSWPQKSTSAIELYGFVMRVDAWITFLPNYILI
jgi:hypothetical protein